MAQDFFQLLSKLRERPEVAQLTEDHRITTSQAMALCCLMDGKRKHEIATEKDKLHFIMTVLEIFLN